MALMGRTGERRGWLALGLTAPGQRVDPGGWGLRSGLSGAVVGLVGGRAQRRAPEAWLWGWDAASFAGLWTRLGKSAPEVRDARSLGCSSRVRCCFPRHHTLRPKFIAIVTLGQTWRTAVVG